MRAGASGLGSVPTGPWQQRPDQVTSLPRSRPRPPGAWRGARVPSLIPHSSSAPAFGAPLSSSPCRGSATFSAIPVVTHALHMPGSFTPSSGGVLTSMSSPAERVSSLPTLARLPHPSLHTPRCSSQLLSRLECCPLSFLYLFTVTCPVQSLTGWTFVRTGTLLILLTPAVLEHLNSVCKLLVENLTNFLQNSF